MLSYYWPMRYAVDAEGQKRLTPPQLSVELRCKFLALIERLPKLLRMKPMEQISDIKILQVNGLAGATGC